MYYTPDKVRITHGVPQQNDRYHKPKVFLSGSISFEHPFKPIRLVLLRNLNIEVPVWSAFASRTLNCARLKLEESEGEINVIYPVCAILCPRHDGASERQITSTLQRDVFNSTRVSFWGTARDKRVKSRVTRPIISVFTSKAGDIHV